LETIFRISLFIILYTYIGYGLILFVWVMLLRWVRTKKAVVADPYIPSLTLIVAAYNEASCIEKKIQNSLALQYPSDKIRYIFVTDGSADGTPEIVSGYPQVKLLHNSARNGKIAAVHRAMQEVETELVVFTDANTMINPEALLLICRHFTDPQTGAVAGEKRIDITSVADATAGEGFYWRYESKLKEWESELYSVIGAAGELFSIRTVLYDPVGPDTVVDDFMISMKISLKGYRVKYEPRAYATETASVSMGEELKRKIRIAAGGIQSLLRLKKLLLPFKHPVLAFEYISHRILRWVVAPYLLLLVFFLNIVCVLSFTPEIYYWLLAAQIAWYGVALAGWLLGKRLMPHKIFWIPYYFCLMNYAMIAGMMRYLFAGQSVLWEKAIRK